MINWWVPCKNPAQPTPDLNCPENKFSNPEKQKQQSNNFRESSLLIMNYFSVCPTFWMRYEPLRQARHTVPSGWGSCDTCRWVHPAVLSTICPFLLPSLLFQWQSLLSLPQHHQCTPLTEFAFWMPPIKVRKYHLTILAMCPPPAGITSANEGEHHLGYLANGNGQVMRESP